MKKLILLMIAAAIVYSCATSKTSEERILEKNRIIQERISLLKEAETSHNPAVLKQAELVKTQIREETEQPKGLKEHAQTWWKGFLPILVFHSILFLCIFIPQLRPSKK